MATLPSTESPPAVEPGGCQVIRAGVVPYAAAWQRQIEIAQAIRESTRPETLLLLEHPHTYTRGRLAPDSDLLANREQLAARGIEVVETDRGGLITYHGPGQLVAYPIIRLRGRGGPHWYVRTLESVIIRSLAQLGLFTTTVAGLTGVWTADGQRKIAAIGVKIAGGIAYHGFAINVEPDLTMFHGIIPCGITDRAVTSMAAELGAAPAMDDVMTTVAREFCAEFALPAR